MGEGLVLDGTVRFQVSLPVRARVRLLRNGLVVAQGVDRHLVVVSHERGAYRVEAYRRHAGRERGWIFSNPIYVE